MLLHSTKKAKNAKFYRKHYTTRIRNNFSRLAQTNYGRKFFTEWCQITLIQYVQ